MRQRVEELQGLKPLMFARCCIAVPDSIGTGSTATHKDFGRGFLVTIETLAEQVGKKRPSGAGAQSKRSGNVGAEAPTP